MFSKTWDHMENCFSNLSNCFPHSDRHGAIGATWCHYAVFISAPYDIIIGYVGIIFSMPYNIGIQNCTILHSIAMFLLYWNNFCWYKMPIVCQFLVGLGGLLWMCCYGCAMGLSMKIDYPKLLWLKDVKSRIFENLILIIDHLRYAPYFSEKEQKGYILW